MRVPDFGCRALLGLALLLVGAPGTARAEPDLLVHGFRVQPAVVRPGDVLIVSGEVRNADETAVASGTLTAGGNGYMVDLVLSTDDVVPIDWAGYSAMFHEDVLLRGGRFSRTPDVGFLEPFAFRDEVPIPADTPEGDYFVCAVVDPGQRIVETAEGNNRDCAEIRVSAEGPPLPDFVAEVTGSRTECRNGRSLTFVTFVIANRGLAVFRPSPAEPGFVAETYLRTADERLPIQSPLVRIGLAPGGRFALNISIDNNAYARVYGQHVIFGLHIDPDNAVAESNEDNNLNEKDQDLPPLDCG